MRILMISFTLLVSATFAHATPLAYVHSCDGLDSIANLAENPKFITNDGVRLAHISTDEPAAGSDHLLIFIANDEMSADCFAVSLNAEGRSFSSFNLKDVKTASYDPKNGRLLTFPFLVSTADGLKIPGGIAKVRINRTGARKGSPPIVTAE